MTEFEKRSIYFACDKVLNGHYPLRVKDEFLNLSSHVQESELADFYGTGDLIANFEAEVASVLEKPAAVFMPSGTMAQVIALRIWCDRVQNKTVAFHETSHLERHEQHAYRELHGLRSELLGQSERALGLQDLQASSGKFAAALIELPQRELGGVLPSWSELEGISNYCRSRKIALHMDGARLWESAPYYRKTYAEISALFDSVYVSFYKGLGGLAGAMLCGPADFIAGAKIWQRRQGGNLIKLYPYLISARTCFRERLTKMAAYHEKAKELALAFGAIEGLNITPGTPSTNMMHISFARSAEKLEAAFLKIASEKKVSLFYRLQVVEEGRSCKVELSVGDGALDMNTSQVIELMVEALGFSR